MSKIEWTEKTWNPWVGCSKTSPGCAHCYAEKMAHRLKHAGLVQYQNVIKGGQWTGEIDAPDEPHNPKTRDKPTMYFVGSMTDVFHKNVPVSWVSWLWNTMQNCPQHTFQLLTKRHKSMRELTDIMVYRYGLLKNIWMGVSVENQRFAYERIPVLQKTKAHIRFLSMEPLLGPVKDLDTTNIDWVIVGGESGPRARPVHPQWVRDIRDKCAQTNTPFFFKQWGAWYPLPSADDLNKYPKSTRVMRWKDGTVSVKLPKKQAGNHLDGQTHRNFPKIGTESTKY